MSSNRRKFMKLAGATAAVAGGWGRNTGCAQMPGQFRGCALARRCVYRLALTSVETRDAIIAMMSDLPIGSAFRDK
jgi:hypothetical protein